MKAEITVDVGPLWLHRDTQFWEDPGAFDSDRFALERSGRRHKFAYLPFSAGRRGCIGEHFAWAEGVVVSATVAAPPRRGAARAARVFYVPAGQPGVDGPDPPEVTGLQENYSADPSD